MPASSASTEPAPEPAPGTPYPGGWRARRATLEAMALLALARFLVHHVRFARWRGRLGQPLAGPRLGEPPVAWTEAWLSRVVLRGALRLPFETKCLPRAMALHWMLRRRGRASVLAVAVLPGEVRGLVNGGLDDLHAWIERGDVILIGASDEPYRVLARFG